MHFLLVWLAVEDVDGQLEQLVAVGGVNIRGIEDGVADAGDAAVFAWQAVDAAEAGLHPFSQCLTGTDGHTVVLPEHEVDIRQIACAGFHGIVGTLLGPVALQCGDEVDVWILGYGVTEPLVAVDGGRRAFQSHNLHHLALAVEPCGNVFSHQAPHLVVVGSHEGGVFLRVGLALEHDDGDAQVVGTVDGGGDGSHLIGRHDEQVDA